MRLALRRLGRMPSFPSGLLSLARQTHFYRLPIRKFNDLPKREAVDFGANGLWSNSRGKERRGNFCETLIFAQRNGQYRQVQLRLLLPRQATTESIPASLKGLRR